MATAAAVAPSASSVDLSDLERHLQDHLAVTWSCLELTEGDLESTSATLNTVRLQAGELKQEIRKTREVVTKWREQLNKAHYLSSFLSASNASMERVSSALSAHPRLAELAAAVAQQQQQQVEEDNDDGKKKKASSKEGKESNNPQGNKKASSAAQKPAFVVDRVPYLTVDEFDSVPKYMKGRLTYDAINSAVNDYNAALEEKYSFLSRGFVASAPIRDKKRYKELKSQESRELRGAQFVTAEELRSAPALRTEAARRAVFTILRHCRRVREVRTPAGAPVKYVSGAK